MPTPSSAILVLNPLSFSRRARVDTSALAALPEVAGAILHVGESAGRKSAIVEAPPLGFVALRPSTGKAATSPTLRKGFGFFRKSAPQARPMAEQDAKQGGAVLRNEFFEVWRQLHPPSDHRPQGDRWRRDDAFAERARVKIVVKMGLSATMARVT